MYNMKITNSPPPKDFRKNCLLKLFFFFFLIPQWSQGQQQGLDEPTLLKLVMGFCSLNLHLFFNRNTISHFSEVHITFVSSIFFLFSFQFPWTRINRIFMTCPVATNMKLLSVKLQMRN